MVLEEFEDAAYGQLGGVGAVFGVDPGDRLVVRVRRELAVVADQDRAGGAHQGDERVGRGDLPGLVHDDEVELDAGQQRRSGGAAAGGAHDMGVPDEFGVQLAVRRAHVVPPLREDRAAGREEGVRGAGPAGELVQVLRRVTHGREQRAARGLGVLRLLAPPGHLPRGPLHVLALLVHGGVVAGRLVERVLGGTALARGLLDRLVVDGQCLFGAGELASAPPAWALLGEVGGVGEFCEPVRRAGPAVQGAAQAYGDAVKTQLRRARDAAAGLVQCRPRVPLPPQRRLQGADGLVQRLRPVVGAGAARGVRGEAGADAVQDALAEVRRAVVEEEVAGGGVDAVLGADSEGDEVGGEAGEDVVDGGVAVGGEEDALAQPG
ncbi:hypothetical protein a10_09502 [Streptomyces acidiscabies]|nr:hypothetical protein a10_09502 [Streptomyces acidiscabies]